MKFALTTAILLFGSQLAVAEDSAALSKAVTAYESHDYAAAETALQKVIASEPDNAAAHAYLSLVQVERDKTGPASEQAAKAVELSADCKEAKVANARLASEQGDNDRAMAILSEAAEANAGDPLVLYHRGLVYLRADQFEAAAADLEKVIEAKPDHAYAYYYAGLAYSKLDKPDKMVDRYQQFLKRKPDAPESKKIRALLRGVR
ncbi:MAG: tetratricopeptide repeat protein [Bryobacteraceae bacterium]